MKINLIIRSLSIPKPIGVVTGKYSNYLLPAVTGIIVLFLLLWVVKPRFSEIFQLKEKIAQSKQDVVTLNNKLTALQGFDRDKLLADARKVEIALPSEKDLPSLLSILERLAAETGAAIASVQLTPGQIAPTGGGGEAANFPVKVTIAGSFAQIKSFLGSVTNASRVVTVRNLTITSSTTQQASLSATLNLESFFQSLTATKFKTSDPLQNLTTEEQEVLAKITVPLPVVITPPAQPPVTGKADPFAPF